MQLDSTHQQHRYNHSPLAKGAADTVAASAARGCSAGACWCRAGGRGNRGGGGGGGGGGTAAAAGDDDVSTCTSTASSRKSGGSWVLYISTVTTHDA
jgi:hypothetical protein